jgi:hypothetical protein
VSRAGEEAMMKEVTWMKQGLLSGPPREDAILTSEKGVRGFL